MLAADAEAPADVALADLADALEVAPDAAVELASAEVLTALPMTETDATVEDEVVAFAAVMTIESV